jgi:hypothetical protein
MIEVSALNHSTLIKYRYFGEGMSVLGFGRRPTLSQVICMLYEGPMRMIEVSALNHSKLVKHGCFGEGISVLRFGQRPTLSKMTC